jgi:hypothetical protein
MEILNGSACKLNWIEIEFNSMEFKFKWIDSNTFEWNFNSNSIE